MAVVAMAMADQPLESRVARLEADVANIRSDIAEMKIDIREVRKQIGELQQGIQRGISDLRDQTQKLGASEDLKLAALDHKLTRGLASNGIWTLLQGAALLGVMARGFGWL